MKGRCNSRTMNGYGEIPRLRSEKAIFVCHCEEPQATWQSRPGSGLSKSDCRAAEVDSGRGFEPLRRRHKASQSNCFFRQARLSGNNLTKSWMGPREYMVKANLVAGVGR